MVPLKCIDLWMALHLIQEFTISIIWKISDEWTTISKLCTQYEDATEAMVCFRAITKHIRFPIFLLLSDSHAPSATAAVFMETTLQQHMLGIARFSLLCVSRCACLHDSEIYRNGQHDDWGGLDWSARALTQAGVGLRVCGWRTRVGCSVMCDGRTDVYVVLCERNNIGINNTGARSRRTPPHNAHGIVHDSWQMTTVLFCSQMVGLVTFSYNPIIQLLRGYDMI